MPTIRRCWVLFKSLAAAAGNFSVPFFYSFFVAACVGLASLRRGLPQRLTAVALFSGDLDKRRFIAYVEASCCKQYDGVSALLVDAGLARAALLIDCF